VSASEGTAGLRARLQEAARWLRFVAAAAFAVFCSTVLVRTAPAAFEPAPLIPPRPLPEDVAPATAADQPASGGSSAAQPQGGEILPAPSPRQILIDIGPPRSEVFVDRRRVGQTPFVGQVRCTPGREITIQVIPERGLPITETRICPP